MERLKATLRTLGILLGLWVVLTGVALATGAISFDALLGRGQPTPVEDEDTEADDEELADAGVDLDAAAPSEVDAGRETVADTTGTEATEPSADATTRAPSRYEVCPLGSEPSLSAITLSAGQPSLVVGCAGGWQVVALGPDAPSRVARFEAPAATGDASPRAGPAWTADVDGDGREDLLLPLANTTAEGATRGGGLFWVARDAFGGIREPVTLAPIAAWAVRSVAASGGATIVALNRANPLARLPSEAWIFAGGSAPRRTASLTAGLDGRALELLDLDRDGHQDLVVAGRQEVTIYFGDGAGAFPRQHRLEHAGVRELAVGDLDGDGGDDLFLVGDGLAWVHAGPVEAMTPRALPSSPEGLREITIRDVDGDGRADVVGWSHPELIVMLQTGELDLEPSPRLRLAGTFGPRRQAWVALDGPARDDLVLLGTAGDEGETLELVIVPNALSVEGEVAPADARPLVDAPLTLRAALH